MPISVEQGTEDDDLRKWILDNICQITKLSDSLEKDIADLHKHIHMHSSFLFHHQTSLQSPEKHGTKEDLQELLKETEEMIRRINDAIAHVKRACKDIHFYDYDTNAPFFDGIHKKWEKRL